MKYSDPRVDRAIADARESYAGGARFDESNEDSYAIALVTLADRLKLLDEAVRYLWNAWSEREGEGQPETAVFGDAELDAYLIEQGAPARRATPEVQAVIREVIGLR